METVMLEDGTMVVVGWRGEEFDPAQERWERLSLRMLRCADDRCDGDGVSLAELPAGDGDLRLVVPLVQVVATEDGIAVVHTAEWAEQVWEPAPLEMTFCGTVDCRDRRTVDLGHAAFDHFDSPHQPLAVAAGHTGRVLVAMREHGVIGLASCQVDGCDRQLELRLEPDERQRLDRYAPEVVDLVVDSNSSPVLVTRVEDGSLALVRCRDPECAGGHDEVRLNVDSWAEPVAVAVDRIDRPVVTTLDPIGRLMLLTCSDVRCSEHRVTPLALQQDPSPMSFPSAVSIVLDEEDRVQIAWSDRAYARALTPSANWSVRLLSCHDPLCGVGVS